jgi:hypothetical protein
MAIAIDHRALERPASRRPPRYSRLRGTRSQGFGFCSLIEANLPKISSSRSRPGW